MPRQLISFDWALKRLLRSKANFDILEGFLSELLKDDIRILEILESESNKTHPQDKFNRVDLKVKNHKDELILIEVQYDRELDFLQRILYASSKAIVEHLQESDAYLDIVKVISVNILFFNLGSGKDYIYHGTTHFKGLHTQDELHLSPKQRKLFHKDAVSAIFPEYYLLKLNQFDDVAKDTLDEWVYFLKNGEIKTTFQAKGLRKASEVLDKMKLSDEERAAYDQYVEDLHYQASMYFCSFEDGRFEEKKQLIKTMLAEDEPLDKIARYTELSVEMVKALLADEES
jgi:predicted transposase/invertase (TIGR01784 family)